MKKAVLKGEYNNDLQIFSRGYLWRSICFDSYRIEFKEEELKPLPVDVEVTKIYHSKHDLIKESVNEDPLNNNDSIDEETLNVIKLDVERLLIDPIFEDEKIRKEIIEILFNYNKINSYKQGFHEICGLIYLELYKDNTNNKLIKVDTFNIFTSLMISMVPNFYVEDNLIGWCLSKFNKYLALVDLSIYELLVKRHGIESQIWLIRWVRLIFMRELGLSNTTRIIDQLLSFDNDLSLLIPFIIIICLIKIKIKLVECEDNGEILQLLLRYPITELNNKEIKEIIELSIKLFKSPENKLESYGISINKKYNKEYNWDKVKDLNRLKMEMKLQRRVRKALNK